MLAAPLTENEPQRLAALHSYHLLDTPPNPDLDEVTSLAASVCNTPMALVTLVDESRQWFMSRVGVDIQETPRELSFCAHAIHRNETMVIPDAHKDQRFADNPLVTSPPRIRFYAGAPLFTPDNQGLGTLCVLDRKPRTLSALQLQALSVLRRDVMNIMQLQQQQNEIRMLLAEAESFGYACSHDLVAPLRRIVGFSRMLSEDFGPALQGGGENLLARIEKSALDMRDLVDGLLSLAQVSRAVLNRSSVNLSEMAAEIVTELRREDPQRQVEILIQPDLTTRGDRRLLRIALANLFHNAWKFTQHRAGAKIEFGAQEREGERFFFVRDNGLGFDMAQADKIFMPFKRLHTSEEYSGLGIGLATVHRIIYRHGGQILAESGPDRGTTILFKL